MIRKILVFISISAFLSLGLNAQKAVVKGEFLTDTLKIGYPVEYALSIYYPSEWQIFFPDSSSDYGMFEYYSKRPFYTVSDDSMSLDSVVYELMSFELDSVQKLSLPVYRFHLNDTLEYFANVDSIMLKEYIEVLPQELDLKENALLRFIPDIFNTKLLLILLGVIIAVLLLIGIFFGKKLMAKWKVWRMSKKHNKFLENFDAYIQSVKSELQKETLEDANSNWKDYLSILESKPYNTYSTKDFISHFEDEELAQSLKNIDAYVYGGLESEKLVDNLISLKHFAEERFELKSKEVLDA
jgi:ABC-type antimicrobial peptide transport system permease subunit